MILQISPPNAVSWSLFRPEPIGFAVPTSLSCFVTARRIVDVGYCPDPRRIPDSTRVPSPWQVGLVMRATKPRDNRSRGKILPSAWGGVTLIYDGECPVCSAYSRAVRIRQDLGGLRLIDARTNPEWVSTLGDLNINLNSGFALLIGNNVYSGHEAINALALISSNSSIFNRANYLLFRDANRAKFLYPSLRCVRNILLKLLGRLPIS
jgi:hypothetical protein